jgi:SAM-dependent methyltransferase
MAESRTHNEAVVEQHTRQAAGYAALTRESAPPPSRALADLLGAEPTDTVLDLACGPGSLSLQLAPHVAQVTGMDLTPAMLDEARDAQARAGANNVTWQCGDAAALPFDDASFDLVASRSAFHHFAEPARVLAEMVRVCRTGGRVAVIDVTPDDDRTAAYDRMERLRDPSHGHAHSAAELQTMGAVLGLGTPAISTRLTGPMTYESILATSFPEACGRADLLALMARDAETGADGLGFRAELDADGKVLVTYPMTTVVWTKT